MNGMPGDSVPELLKREMGSLSGREARAARHLLANYPMAGLTTVAEFAAQSGVSTATVLRLVKRLGFPVFSDFQASLRRHLEETLQSPLIRFSEHEKAAGGHAETYLERFLASIEAQARAMHAQAADMSEEFERIVALLSDSKRDIHVLGGRYSSNVGAYFADLLSSVRGKVFVVAGQTQRWPQHLLDVGRSSVLVAIDVRRYQQDVIDFVEAADRKGATIVLLTDPWRSPAARVADHVLTVPVDAPSVFDVLTPGLALAEALVGATAGRLGAIGRARMTTLEDLRGTLAPEEDKINRPRLFRTKDPT